jgi:hypothetical protein
MNKRKNKSEMIGRKERIDLLKCRSKERIDQLGDGKIERRKERENWYDVDLEKLLTDTVNRLQRKNNNSNTQSRKKNKKRLVKNGGSKIIERIY